MVTAFPSHTKAERHCLEQLVLVHDKARRDPRLHDVIDAVLDVIEPLSPAS
jgi:hypothetical protein